MDDFEKRFEKIKRKQKIDNFIVLVVGPCITVFGTLILILLNK